MAAKCRHTDEKRMEIITEVLRGDMPKAVAARHGISLVTMYTWLRKWGYRPVWATRWVPQ